jgi:hypothetical protein
LAGEGKLKGDGNRRVENSEDERKGSDIRKMIERVGFSEASDRMKGGTNAKRKPKAGDGTRVRTLSGDKRRTRGDEMRCPGTEEITGEEEEKRTKNGPLFEAFWSDPR